MFDLIFCETKRVNLNNLFGCCIETLYRIKLLELFTENGQNDDQANSPCMKSVIKRK